jgi:tetratricopeptide (TPR) repeat protein
MVCLLLRGFVQYKLRHFALAIGEFGKSLSIRPEPESFIARGTCYIKTNNPARAIADYTAALPRRRKMRPRECVPNAWRAYRGVERDPAVAAAEAAMEKSKVKPKGRGCAAWYCQGGRARVPLAMRPQF